MASTLVLLPSVGRAESAAAAAQRAERLFAEGRAAMEEQSFDFACSAFAESQKLDPAAGTLVNWGVCLENQGKLASAVGAYKESLASAPPGSDPDRERFVEERIAALDPRLCRVTIAVRGSPAGMRIALDAKALGASRWNAPIETDRGFHYVEVSAPGYRSWSEAFTLDSDGLVRVVEVPLLEAERLSPAVSPPQAAHAPAPSRPDRLARVELAVAGGVALAGAASTVYLGLRAASAWDERQRHCPQHRCDETAVAASDRAAGLARAADVAAAVTGVAVGFGLYVVLSAGRPSSPPRSSVALYGDGDRAQVQWSGAF